MPDQGSDALYMFHCIGCGSNVQKYQGRIAKIVPVLEPSGEAITLPQCRQCGNYYNFQTHKSVSVDVTKITLYTNPVGKSLFYCFSGRGDPMLIYTHTGIFSNVDKTLKQVPFTSACVNPGCQEMYFFNDLV